LRRGRSDKAEQARALIANRYPAGPLPHDAASALAKEVGLTTSTIRYHAREMGRAFVRSIALPVVICGSCEQPYPHQTKARRALGEGALRVCRNCRWVDLPCATCETVFRRRTAEMVRRAPQGPGLGQYCSRTCYFNRPTRHGFRGPPTTVARFRAAALANLQPGEVISETLAGGLTPGQLWRKTAKRLGLSIRTWTEDGMVLKVALRET